MSLGSPTPEESARWTSICEEFVRKKKLGGDDVDGSLRIASSMLDVPIGKRMVIIGQVLIVAVVFDVLYRRKFGEN